VSDLCRGVHIIGFGRPQVNDSLDWIGWSVLAGSGEARDCSGLLLWAQTVLLVEAGTDFQAPTAFLTLVSSEC
jgi:hypothetical protein